MSYVRSADLVSYGKNRQAIAAKTAKHPYILTALQTEDWNNT